MLFWLHTILSRFFHRLLDLFTCQACHEFLAEPDYPDLRDIMSGSPLKTSPHQWVDSLISVSGNTERNRPQDVRDTHLFSIEHLRQDTHELIVIEMQYKVVPRWYSLERFVGEDSPSSSPSFQLHVQYNSLLDLSTHADSLSSRRMKGRPVNRPPGTHKVQDMINRFADVHEARGYTHLEALIKTLQVPPTVNLNVMHVAVLAKLVSGHRPTNDGSETTSWVWARTFFACLQDLCERENGGSLEITSGPAAGITGRPLPKDTDSFVWSIASYFLKFFKYNLEKGDLGSSGEDDLVHAVLDDFEPVYEATFSQLEKNADTITITREEYEELLCVHVEEQEKGERVQAEEMEAAAMVRLLLIEESE